MCHRHDKRGNSSPKRAAQILNLVEQPPSRSSNEQDQLAAFYRRFAWGALSDNEFTVPNGKILIVTDYRWQVIPTPAGFAANSVLDSVLISRIGSESFRTMHTSSPVNLTTEYSTMNRLGGSDHITAGVPVGSGRYLCASASSKTATFTAFHSVVFAEINGYLIAK